ncbi:Outer membrane protein Imp, required for envelope biogenesis / Organic solvent tolerance protein precursor [hydrothermal vent metagenome]|uniref:Outer membrane protein Imp, required for envelope biogenesis / Organic solvent tolerance protein n=1 Tax=hydrothermal vent metagenome TaxID=652676 RepID=A0A1W1BTL8_9ZZZZ
MLNKKENRASSDKLIIHTDNKKVEFKKLFLTTEQDLWIEAKKATREKEHYKIYNSRLSSCDKIDPDWTIEFAEAHFRKKREFITLKDARVRFFDTTILYLPYLAFPTVNERTSGLLFPKFQFSDIEGLVYQQSYFYAPTNNFDMEFTPQIRTSRGYGGYITSRYVDSNHSSGLFKTGYFDDFNSFSKSNKLHTEHYGFELQYKSTDFLPKSDFFDAYDSGLYLNSTYLTDLEYLNLQKDSASALVNSNLIESRFNAFIYDEERYLGLYSKFYIDTSKQSNSETLQELPTIQYHNYMQKLFTDKIFYSFDAKVHNYTRAKGSRAYQTEFDLPITYYDSFFNDYLNFSLSENLYLSDVFFSNLGYSSERYRFYRNYHTLELSSDLIKSYGEDTHTLHPYIQYTRPSLENEEPNSYSELKENQKELFVTQTQKEKLSMGLSQYYYNNKLDMNLFHRLAWVEYPNEELDKGDINNEISYRGESLDFYSNLFYSLDKDKIHSLTTSLSYNQSNYDIILTHFYNNDFLVKNRTTSFINSSFVHNYNKHNQWFFNYDFDLKQDFNHYWDIGWSHRQKCWGSKVSFGQERIPNVESSFRNNKIYFELTLNPFGGIAQNQEFSSQGR